MSHHGRCPECERVHGYLVGRLVVEPDMFDEGRVHRVVSARMDGVVAYEIRRDRSCEEFLPCRSLKGRHVVRAEDEPWVYDEVQRKGA